MKTLIAYCTKYGTTEKCAKKLANNLSDDTKLVNLKITKDVDVSEYDAVIIGGSINIEQIQKEVKAFCKNNLDQLAQKKIGLFICCMAGQKKAKDYLKTSFPEKLLNISKVKECFGGELIYEKMNFFSRFLLKKITKINESVSKISDERILKFASIIKSG